MGRVDDGVELRVQPLGARNRRLEQFARRHLPPLDQPRQPQRIVVIVLPDLAHSSRLSVSRSLSIVTPAKAGVQGNRSVTSPGPPLSRGDSRKTTSGTPTRPRPRRYTPCAVLPCAPETERTPDRSPQPAAAPGRNARRDRARARAWRYPTSPRP